LTTENNGVSIFNDVFYVIKGQTMNDTENADDCLVYKVSEAGRLLGMSKNAAYLAASRNDLPVIRIGKQLRVPKAALHAMIEAAGQKVAGQK
jgi:excisionase family DNA binding protein